MAWAGNVWRRHLQPWHSDRHQQRHAISGRFVAAALLCSAPQIAVAKNICSQVVELLRKSVDPTVGRYIQMLLRGDYRGKMPETLHRWLCPCEQRCPIVAPECVQLIVTIGANHPHNRIRATIGCRDYRRARSIDGAAPRG
jgi:hypothetical protein